MSKRNKVYKLVPTGTEHILTLCRDEFSLLTDLGQENDPEVAAPSKLNFPDRIFGGKAKKSLYEDE